MRLQTKNAGKRGCLCKLDPCAFASVPTQNRRFNSCRIIGRTLFLSTRPLDPEVEWVRPNRILGWKKQVSPNDRRLRRRDIYSRRQVTGSLLSAQKRPPRLTSGPSAASSTTAVRWRAERWRSRYSLPLATASFAGCR